MKAQGASTLGGQNIWFDEEVRRLNADGRGVLLGEFAGDDKIIVFTRHHYYVAGYELTHHFPEDTVRVEKYDPERVYSVTYFDEGLGFYYVKRFAAITNGGSQQEYLEADCRLVEVVDFERPVLRVTYQGANAARPADTVDVGEYIGVKSHKAKGKRITTYDVGALAFLEPEPADEEEIDEADLPDAGAGEGGGYEEEAGEVVKADLPDEVQSAGAEAAEPDVPGQDEAAEASIEAVAEAEAEPEKPVEIEIIRGEQLDLF